MSEIRSQATPARDELAEKQDALGKIAYDILRTSPWAEGLTIRNCILLSQAIGGTAARDGWSKPHTVNSATELDALPVESVILVDSGRYGLNAWQKHANERWCEASHYEESMTSAELGAGNLPATVLFTPGDAG